MARYNRIFRKKADAGDLLVAPPASLMDYLRNNINTLALAAGLVAIVIAGFYGVSYYKASSGESAQKKLYEASSAVPPEGATTAAADEAIKALKEFVERGGPAELVIQGRLELAAVYARKGDHESALAQYSAAVKEAPKGGLLWEVASAGEAYSLSMSGKHSEAAGKFKELSETARYYPRQELLYSYGLSLAAAGDKDGAVKALNRVKTEFPDYLSQDYIADTIARVESGKFQIAMKAVSTVVADTSTGPQTGPAAPAAKPAAPSGG